MIVSDTLSDVTYPGARTSAVDSLGFDRGTGTGTPAPGVERNLRLMNAADDAFDVKGYTFFIDHRHAECAKVHQFGAPDTEGLAPHRRDTEMFPTAFPDMTVHNDPYDVQLGQGEWTVAIGRLSGTFTGPLVAADGSMIPPTGGSFDTLFTTIARWQNDRMVEEFVLMDFADVLEQVGVTAR